MMNVSALSAELFTSFFHFREFTIGQRLFITEACVSGDTFTLEIHRLNEDGSRGPRLQDFTMPRNLMPFRSCHAPDHVMKLISWFDQIKGVIRHGIAETATEFITQG